MVRSILRRVLALVPPRNRRLFAVVVTMGLVTAVMEMVGVASILPFMSVVMNPEVVSQTPLLAAVVGAFGASTAKDQLTVIGLATLSLLLAASASGALNLFVQQRLAAHITAGISSELFRGYVRMPHAFHLERDAASLYKVVNDDARNVYHGYLLPLMAAFSRALVAAVVLAVLFVTNPVVATAIIAAVGAPLIALFLLMRRRQLALGQLLSAMYEDRLRIANETLGGLKDLVIAGRVEDAAEEFQHRSERLTRTEHLGSMISVLPRFLIEMIAFGGIVIVTLVLLRVGTAQQTIPILALYAFAGYRLLPALQQLYITASQVKYGLGSIEAIECDLRTVRAHSAHQPDNAVARSMGSEALAVREALQLRNVWFRYESAPTPALRDVSFDVKVGESVGIVGRTGSGKSTIADLVLGFHTPSAGAVLIDGKPLTGENLPAWHRAVGYVSQRIFLANASVAANIAFGVPAKEIDMAKVKRAAEQAEAATFIERLPGGYASVVGERGVRLSGGQLQRLGIARALYNDPSVLILDEATSALDAVTEEAVMRTVRSMSGRRTILIIAHRLRTVEGCDRIVVMHEGEVADTGTFSELSERSTLFRDMVAKQRLLAREQPMVLS